MEDILHHLSCIKPWKEWDKLPINWCSISSINCFLDWLLDPNHTNGDNHDKIDNKDDNANRSIVYNHSSGDSEIYL